MFLNFYLNFEETGLEQDPDGEIENSGKSIFEIPIPNFCYIQVVVFDLSYLPVAAVGTQQVRYDEKMLFPEFSISPSGSQLGNIIENMKGKLSSNFERDFLIQNSDIFSDRFAGRFRTEQRLKQKLNEDFNSEGVS